MKKLNIDLELLVQSFSFDSDGLCTEYLDTETGNIINLSEEVYKVAEGNLDESKLQDWEKEFLEDAYDIVDDEDNRYILIPKIDSSHFYDAMSSFIFEKVSDDKLKEELVKALKESNPMRNFKNVLANYDDVLDGWYDYEDEKAQEYVIEWLSEREIECV